MEITRERKMEILEEMERRRWREGGGGRGGEREIRQSSERVCSSSRLHL